MKESVVVGMRSFQDKSAFLGALGLNPQDPRHLILRGYNRHPFEKVNQAHTMHPYESSPV